MLTSAVLAEGITIIAKFTMAAALSFGVVEAFKAGAS